MNYGQRRNKKKKKLSFRRWMRKFYAIEGIYAINSSVEAGTPFCDALINRIVTGRDAQIQAQIDALYQLKRNQD